MKLIFEKRKDGKYYWSYPTIAAGESEKRSGTVTKVQGEWIARVDGHPDTAARGRTRGLAVTAVEKRVFGRTVSV